MGTDPFNARGVLVNQLKNHFGSEVQTHQPITSVPVDLHFYGLSWLEAVVSR